MGAVHAKLNRAGLCRRRVHVAEFRSTVAALRAYGRVRVQRGRRQIRRYGEHTLGLFADSGTPRHQADGGAAVCPVARQRVWRAGAPPRPGLASWGERRPGNDNSGASTPL